jgi:hypothetical protein
MTRLFQPPPGIEVALNPHGAPGRVGGVLFGSVEVQTRWTVDQDWWERPVAREYWKLLVGDRLLVEVFHDLDQDAWFLERIYD